MLSSAMSLSSFKLQKMPQTAASPSNSWQYPEPDRCKMWLSTYSMHCVVINTRPMTVRERSGQIIGTSLVYTAYAACMHARKLSLRACMHPAYAVYCLQGMYASSTDVSQLPSQRQAQWYVWVCEAQHHLHHRALRCHLGPCLHPHLYCHGP